MDGALGFRSGDVQEAFTRIEHINIHKNGYGGENFIASLKDTYVFFGRTPLPEHKDCNRSMPCQKRCAGIRFNSWRSSRQLGALEPKTPYHPVHQRKPRRAEPEN
jgi:hypothetical protein